MDPTTKRPPLWNRNFIQCCISYFLMNIAYYVQVPTMPLYLSEELGIDNSQVGLVLSSYTIGVLCMRPFSGYLVDCFSRKYLYIFAFAMFSLFFVGYFWATTVLLLILIRLFQGTFMGLTSVSGNTITIDVIPSARRGEGMGFYGLAINIAMSLAPLIAVATSAKQGFNAVVWSSLAFSALGIFSVLFIPEAGESKASAAFLRPVHPAESYSGGYHLYVCSCGLRYAAFVCRALRQGNRCCQRRIFLYLYGCGCRAFALGFR